ncbi:unnamed protein product [Blepharisma stoltei]|uniref:Uncharacterized protein n=1 Tax=Blepharisma stoltei TaxID=1481888 RepID=A0AAU9KBK6_9CILI|nr:unnamed protein product [Blepharisma stoltei]
MEYNEDPNEIKFDENKFQYVMTIGEKYSYLHCPSIEDKRHKEKCMIFSVLSKNFGEEVTKLQNKLRQCYAMHEERNYYSFRPQDFDQCVYKVEQENVVFLEQYYEAFFNTENLI